MFVIKIFVTLLLIQSLQLTFAQQDEDDLGPIESLPRFEARRQSTLSGNNKEDFEYDDDNGASRGPVNPLPARSGRNDDNNDDDYDENQAPQRGDNGSPSVTVVSNPGLGSVKGTVLPSSTGRLSLPRFPSQPINSFVAPLPVVPVSVAAQPNIVPVSVATPSAPITVVGKTNLGGDSSDTLPVPRLVRPNEPTKTVRVVKTRVIRPNPIAVDQSASLSQGIGETKSSQVAPKITRVVRPILVARQPQPAFVTPVFQPVVQPVTSGSSGPNVIVSGGVKTASVVANSKVQPPRLRVITTRRPTTPLAPVDIDEDVSAGSRPAPGQISGVKTIAAANPVPLVPLSRFAPTRTLVQPVIQPVRQPSRLEVIYADEKLSTQEEDENEEDANAAGLSRFNIVKFNRPSAPVPVRAVPQPYLVPLNVQGSRPIQPTNNGVFFQPSIQVSAQPTLVPSGKTNSFRSTFNVRPQPVPVAPTLVPVAPIQPNPAPVLIDSGSASGSRSVVSPVSKVQPPRLRVITTQRPTTPVQIVDEAGLASGVSGVKGSAVTSGSRSIVRPVLVRTPVPTTRPLVQVQEEPLPTFQQIDLIRTQPAARPFTTFQEQTKPLPSISVVQPAPRPTAQPIVQIRDGASSAELPLPPPPRPIQIVRVTPAPTVRPITQVTQVRESSLPNVQPVQVAPARLIRVSQPQSVQISEPARPFTQIRESNLPFFQPLDPALRPAIPTVQVTNQVQESIAPREIVVRQPNQPIQVIQPQRQQLVQVNQVQQPSVTEIVQLKESAVPITSSQGNLGAQRVSQPQPVQKIVSVPQEPAPTPQSFEILRLREPSFPQFPLAPRQPQPLVPARPRLIPAALPTQTVQTNLPVSRPNIVQISQEKETVSLAQPLAPVVIKQQSQFGSLTSVQQVQTNVAPVAPVTNVQFVQPIAQPRPLFRQQLVPRLIDPLSLPRPVQESQSLGQPITVQNRLSQPTLLIQQQRPAIVISQPQPQPSPLIVQRQRPVAPLSVQGSLSQTGEQQLVQIREKVSSIPEQFSQIEQIRLARA